MTLLFVDGLDTADWLLKYVNDGLNTTAPPTATGTRFGVGMMIALPQNKALKAMFAPSAKAIVGCAVSLATLTDGNQSLLTLYGDTGLTAHLSLRTMTDGSLKLFKGDGVTLLATSAAGVLPSAGTWFYLEMSATVADAGGRAIVRINGGATPVIDFTGDTKNAGTAATLDAVRFYNNSTGSFNSFDDIYVCDGLGSTNNDFLGDVRVQTLLPSGAGSSTQFTPSVGSNWDNVNDSPYVPTTYNSSSTPGQRDTYAMTDLLAGTGTVFGVQGAILAQKSDAGVASIKAAIKSGASVYYDPTAALAVGLVGYRAIREVDPATSAAWTATNVNALEFGAEVA